MSKEKNKGGRPKELTVQQIEEAFEKYLQDCASATEEVATAKGVVVVSKPEVPVWEYFVSVYLKMTREGMSHYESSPGYEQFFDTIKRIKQHIYSCKVRAVGNGKGSTTGLIFDLKCNYGWRDKQEIDVNHGGEIKVTMNID